MSDCAANRLREKENFQVLSSTRNPGQLSFGRHSLWMAHWTRASRSTESQNGKSCGPSDEINSVGYSKDCGSLPVELMKTRLMVGVSRGTASVGNAQQFSSNTWGVAHDVCQEVERGNIVQGDRSFESSMMLENVNLYAAKTVVSERFSVHKLPGLSLSSHKVLSSDYLSSEWSHLPMFEINRKIDCILRSKQSAPVTLPDNTVVSQKSLKVNMSTSNVMTFSSQEYQFHSHRITDESMSQCKSAEGILSHLEDHTRLNSDPSGQKLKRHLSTAPSCSCSMDGTNSSSSLADEHASFYFANSKESPHWSNENKFGFSPSRRENKIVESTVWDQKSRTDGGYQKQQEVVFHEPLLSREYKIEPGNDSINSKLDEENICGTYKAHGAVFPDQIHGEYHHLKTYRSNSAVNLTDSDKLPDATENMSTVKSKGEEPTNRKLPMDKCSDSSKQMGPGLFQMLTLPSKSHVAYSKDSLSSRKSGSKGVCIYSPNIDSHLFGAQNISPATTDKLYSDNHHASNSSAGFASTSTQKDSGCPNTSKTKQLAPSSIKGVSSCSEGNNSLNATTQYVNSSPNITSANKKEWSMSKTSMNMDLVLFQVSGKRNPIYDALIESPACPGPSNRWLKRLRHVISDPHLPCSKRSKVGDGPSPGGTSGFGRRHSRDRDNADMTDHVKEDKLVDERSKVERKQGSPVSAKALNSWIGRWCHGGTPTFHGTSDQGKQTPKPNTTPDEHEGQFPSIAAMAMMGRVMNKLRPCELKRRGPSVAWKSEGL